MLNIAFDKIVFFFSKCVDIERRFTALWFCWELNLFLLLCIHLNLTVTIDELKDNICAEIVEISIALLCHGKPIKNSDCRSKNVFFQRLTNETQ